MNDAGLWYWLSAIATVLALRANDGGNHWLAAVYAVAGTVWLVNARLWATTRTERG